MTDPLLVALTRVFHTDLYQRMIAFNEHVTRAGTVNSFVAVSSQQQFLGKQMIV